MIILQSDSSISRFHCTIRIHAAQAMVSIKDLKSSYGTHVNGTKLDPEKDCIFELPIEIKIGGLNSDFTLCRDERCVQNCLLKFYDNHMIIL